MNLIPAKISAPRIGRLVNRVRVRAALDEAIEPAICWITGPAGTGKTTAIAEYLQTKQNHSVWYRVDKGDEDVATFFNYLTQCIKKKNKSVTGMAKFRAEYINRPVDFARNFFRAWFANLPSDCFVVFDDVHAAEQKVFHEVLAAALHELPAQVRCFCLSRTLPFAELDNLQIKGQLRTLDHSVLDFTVEETRRLFVSRGISNEFADQAFNLARGWAAGLVLITEQIKRSPHARPALNLGESKSLLFHYLAKQIFADLPQAEQNLLVDTSVLPEVSPIVANALMERDDSAQLLLSIYHRHLFISRQGGAPVYIYHDLLREFLQQQLLLRHSPDRLIELQRKAARTLAANNRIEHAIELALESADWPYGQHLLLTCAEMLLQSNRHDAFISWSKRLQAQFATDHWLDYWLGMAWIPKDDRIAEQHFELAYRRFGAEGDVLGVVLAVSGCITALFYSWRAAPETDCWAKRLLDHADNLPAFHNPNQEITVRTALLRAFLLVNETSCQRESFRANLNRMIELLADQSTIDVSLCCMASKTLLDAAMIQADAKIFEQAVTIGFPCLADSDLPVWTRIIWLTTFGWMHSSHFPKITSTTLTAEAALNQAIDLAEKEGLRRLRFEALYRRFMVAAVQSDREQIEWLYQQLKSAADDNSTEQQKAVAVAEIGVLCFRNQYADAQSASQRLLDLARQARTPGDWATALLAAVQPLFGLRQWSAVVEFLQAWVDKLPPQLARRANIYIQVAEAFSLTDVRLSITRLKQCLAQIKAENWLTAFYFIPSLMSEMVEKVLQYHNDPMVYQELIKHRRLQPNASSSSLWPWPVKIFALGKFEIIVAGKSIKFVGKVPKRPLELLKLLVAVPGHKLESKKLLRVLWAEETHTSTKAMLMALVRLRRILQSDDSVLFEDGVVKLNDALLWVDAKEFDSTIDRVIHLGVQGKESIEAIECLFEQYHGPLFGSESPQPWFAAARDRLHEKFLKLVSVLGENFERQQQWHHAIRIYERGLKQDNMVEEFYRGLIRCNLALGEPNNAMAVFRRCRELLSIVLGTLPAPATVQLFEQIRMHHYSSREIT